MPTARLKTWWDDEDGATTVDWVVLTATIIGLGVGVINLLADGVSDVASGVKDGLLSYEPDPLDL